MPPAKALTVSPNTNRISTAAKSCTMIAATQIINIEANAAFPAFNAFCFTHSSYFPMSNQQTNIKN